MLTNGIGDAYGQITVLSMTIDAVKHEEGFGGGVKERTGLAQPRTPCSYSPEQQASIKSASHRLLLQREAT